MLVARVCLLRRRICLPKEWSRDVGQLLRKITGMRTVANRAMANDPPVDDEEETQEYEEGDAEAPTLPSSASGGAESLLSPPDAR